MTWTRPAAPLAMTRLLFFRIDDAPRLRQVSDCSARNDRKERLLRSQLAMETVKFLQSNHTQETLRRVSLVYTKSDPKWRGFWPIRQNPDSFVAFFGADGVPNVQDWNDRLRMLAESVAR